MNLTRNLRDTLKLCGKLAPSANESADAILESLASEEGVDYSLRRISSPDFLQTEDKTEEAGALGRAGRCAVFRSVTLPPDRPRVGSFHPPLESITKRI